MIKSQHFHMKEVPLSSLFPLLPARGEKGGRKRGRKRVGGDGFLRRLTCHPLKSEKGDKKGEKKENIFGNIFLREHFLEKLLGFRTIQVVFSAKLRIGNSC